MGEIMIKKLTLLGLLIFMSLSRCTTSFAIDDLHFTAEAYNWSNSMKKAMVTTKEKGLVFRINIKNDDDMPAEANNLILNIDMYQNEERLFLLYAQTTIRYLYIPPNEETYVFFEIDFPYDFIGEYKAEITYSTDNYVPVKIEPYPFRFDVVSEEIFNERIKQSQPLIDLSGLTLNITIFNFGFTIFGVAIGAIIMYYASRPK